MQVTLEIPNEALVKASALARQQSRSLGSVVTDFIMGRSSSLQKTHRPNPLNPLKSVWVMPVMQCSQTFTDEDVARWEAENDER